MIHIMFVNYTLSSVWVAEWQPAAHSIGHLFSLYFGLFVFWFFLNYLSFWF